MYSKDNRIIDRREMLRVKLKCFAAEARIIRREEQRTHGDLRDELSRHRRGIVRWEARHAHLAYGFVRGRTLAQMEPKSDTTPDWEKIRKMLKKYGPAGMLEPEVMKKAA